MMVRKERIPSWRKMVFGFELIFEEDGGDEVIEKRVGKGY
jgi:hypothetical protein